MVGPSAGTGRVVFLGLALVFVSMLGYSYATVAPTDNAGDISDRVAGSNLTADVQDDIDLANDSRSGGSTPAVGSMAPGAGVTVVATQGFYVSDERAELTAFAQDGDIVYYNDTYRVYFDVDPVEGERYTVEYVAAEHLNGTACISRDACTRNVVERVNLSTGQTTRVYSEVTPRVYSARWHDVDRLNDTHIVIADIVNDAVVVLDTRTGEPTWQWNASEDYSTEAGGQPGDWTHVNDVEVLPDGRIMASIRNMDEVVFLEPGVGLNESWTLGEDDDYDVLHEQHNPDYIPAENGGPSVVVADSENNRIVEYHRDANGDWERSWSWRDLRLQWPRDADRLPNGNTLVVDTHGDRVVEVGPDDRIVWNISIGMPYDAERLGTGDESRGGPAARLRDPSGATSRPLAARMWLTLKDTLPGLVVNGLLYMGPSWFRFSDVLVVISLGGTLLSWAVFEFRWSSLTVRSLAGRLRGALPSRAERGRDG